MLSCHLLHTRVCAQNVRVLAPQRLSIAAPYPVVRQSTVARALETAEIAETDDKAEDKEPVFEDAYEIDTLSIEQVQELIKVVSEETNIAEVSLQLAELEVTFRRSAGVPVHAIPAPAPAVATQAPPAAAPAADESLDVYSEDESTLGVRSPKVGIMRYCKYLKGKQISREPMVSAGDKVRKGQIIAYIDQLGTHVPVEAPMAGEVAEFYVQEGQPVEYDEEVLSLAPFFGGHIIGDAKLQV